MHMQDELWDNNHANQWCRVLQMVDLGWCVGRYFVLALNMQK